MVINLSDIEKILEQLKSEFSNTLILAKIENEDKIIVTNLTKNQYTFLQQIQHLKAKLREHGIDFKPLARLNDDVAIIEFTTKYRYVPITEKTVYDKIFNVLQNASLSERGSCEGYSIELGELALQVFSKLSDSQKVAFKGEYSREDAYTRETIDIDSEKIYLEFIDFQKEFETTTSLTQHDMWSDDEEENKDVVTFDDMEDLSGKDKLDMMYECDLKPYLRDRVSVDIFKRECFVQFTHTHQYVILQAIFDKTNFNYTMYEHVKAIVDKILKTYYDKLLKLNTDN